MRDNSKIWMWKICIFVLAVLIIWQIGNLLTNVLGRSAKLEHFVATEGNGATGDIEESQTDRDMNVFEKQDASQQPGADYQHTNFDRIRVVLTNKENGSVYHEEVTYYQGTASQVETAGQGTLGVYVHEEYRGNLEIWETEEGYVVINELPIEEYLYSVVPSEMPAGYPMEALKAQAICARTYAYLHILSPAYPQWNAHVDDTTAFQVYHSVEEQESTTRAVNETEGVVLLSPDGRSLAQTYYYSTSCGLGSDAHVWRTPYADDYPYIMSRQINREVAVEVMAQVGAEVLVPGEMAQVGAEEQVSGGAPRVAVSAPLTTEDFARHINSVNGADYEAQESWYRWSYDVKQVNLKRILTSLQKRYEANPELVLTLQGSTYVSRPIEELEKLVDLVIDKRQAGGVADEMLVITEKNVYKVITELNIRYVLNDGVTKVQRQDGTEAAMPSLLPSAFILLENEYKDGEVIGYQITGGGFGHGAGMSQNAAKVMAQEGMSAEDILTFFFAGCTLERKQ